MVKRTREPLHNAARSAFQSENPPSRPYIVSHKFPGMQRLFRLTGIWLIILSMLNAQLVWAITEAESVGQAVRTNAGVGGLFKELEPLEQALDRGSLELDEMLFKLAFDAAEIERFVRADVRFQAYPGLLRGARGTLISRSGNALDQGILLARLLKDAGSEARIARGSLHDTDAKRLLEQMLGPASWPSAWAKTGRDPVEAWFRGRVNVETSSLRSDVERVLGSSLAAAEAIGPQVEGIADTRPVDDRLLEEVRNYYWVEHRLGPGDPWIAAHPAFGDAEPPSVEAEGYMADTIPSDLQHRVRIEVRMEKRLGSKVTEETLMPPWEKPAANAAYLPQTIGVLPYTGQTADSNQFLDTAAAEAELFVVTWNDSIAAGAQVFTLQGDALPMEALSPGGEFVKQVSDRGAMAVNALSGIGLSQQPQDEQLPAKRLERLWIEYTLIAPGGAETSMRRYLLDLDDQGRQLVHQQPVDEGRWLTEARAAMLQSRSLLVGTGPVNPAWLVQQLLESASAGRPTLLELERRASQSDPSIGPSVLNGLDNLPDTRWIQYLFATQTATGYGEKRAAYLHQPTMVSFNHGVRARGEGLRGYEQIDILFNARRVVERQGESWLPHPATAMLSGVLETRQEQLQVASRGGEGGASAFESLSQAAERFVRIAPDERSNLESLDFAPGAARAAQRELDAGYALLVPPVKGVDHWWRIDPGTGTATGMAIGAGGYGGATATEYIIYGGIIIGTLLMYYSFYSCFTSESGLALFCCLVDSWLTGIIIAALAFTAGVLSGAALGAVGAGMGAATAEVELVTAIINFIVLDGGSTVLSFTDFRIRACGSLTGT